MLIDIFSDPHLDQWMRFYKDKYNRVEDLLEDRFLGNPGVDTVICAGDCGNGMVWQEKLKIFLEANYKNVFMVPGNHDFYGELVVPSGHQFLKLIDGVTFAGAPLWTNFNKSDRAFMKAVECINDFRSIPELKFTPALMKLWHKRDTEFLKSAHSTVKVTHFSPSTRSFALRFLGNPLNPYFLNDQEDLIDKHCRLWVHGHTHEAFDYMIGDCRVVCHPIGYPRENMNSLMIQPKMVEI